VSTFLVSPLPSALNPANYLAKRRKARLEVHPAGVDMLDYIILTFVFVENKRRVREESVAESSGRGTC